MNHRNPNKLHRSNPFQYGLAVLLSLIFSSIPSHAIAEPAATSTWKNIPLTSRITHAQPLAGIVLWDDSENLKKVGDAISLEFSYLKYSDIVVKRGEYDWTKVDTKLTAIAKRKHQAVFRFYDTYVAKPTAIPAYIKSLEDYKEVTALSEKKPTGFPDWSNAELKRFIFEFYEKFALRYDNDPRLAYLETGFGLWAEYHIYDGPFKLGATFPDMDFQSQFLQHLSKQFKTTPWMISVDAADQKISPIVKSAELLKLNFGLFDDSFLAKEHPKVNEKNWNALDRKRYTRLPGGGEFSYYNKHDQQTALAAEGPNGESFEKAAARFHITFMIGNDQPKFQPVSRILSASLACGYRFRATQFDTDGINYRLTIQNAGIAPIYYDAFPAVNGSRSTQSLKGLQPGESLTHAIPISSDDKTRKNAPIVTIESARLVSGQVIEIEAELK